MQLVPETAAELGADPHVPEQNVEAGTHYLRQLLARYRRHHDYLVRAIAGHHMLPIAKVRTPDLASILYVAEALCTTFLPGGGNSGTEPNASSSSGSSAEPTFLSILSSVAVCM